MKPRGSSQATRFYNFAGKYRRFLTLKVRKNDIYKRIAGAIKRSHPVQIELLNQFVESS